MVLFPDSNNIPFTSSFTFIGDEQSITQNSKLQKQANNSSNSSNSAFDNKLSQLQASRNNEFQPIQRS